ncbi:right-handed parallel beta-helix repeat-containing protein [Paenibacillus ginsengarvi]|uniref:Right-handed parallel beta-helix repeat-containing protein n=1 Tax=Paenibacillus ginsengarvi TaxID=400777 RepID=A0A3B0C8C3_9BACL|nr:right-handed parallel beta-helix repeat-containing protein [Paenibacillus ginsengarvi]RKN81920.1 right-handed parallel beta-helix repeat-containing protein [Paenibacillus ginsengarvi]
MKRLLPVFLIGFSLALLFQSCSSGDFESQISPYEDQNGNLFSEEVIPETGLEAQNGDSGAVSGSNSGLHSGLVSSYGSSFGLGSGSDSSSGSSSDPKACSASKLQDILAPATSSNAFVRVDCNLTLKSSDVITKRLVYEGAGASNLTLNCNNAKLKGNDGVGDGKDMITVKSIQDGSAYSRPENIKISNCIVEGSVRVMGLGQNGEAESVLLSSLSSDHTARAQQAAPRNIEFNNLTINSKNRIPLYLSPGVTYSKILNSMFKGTSGSVVIYLDAESAFNIIKNNEFNVTTKSREVIAIDGSANNQIINNRLFGLNNGGIFLYRNCGEGGTIRHQTPSYNVISNNYFYYHKYDGKLPSIWLSSRDGAKNYCELDRGYTFGSSESNQDHASSNIISNNKIQKFSPSKMIRLGGSATNNVITGNKQVE